MSSYRDDSHDIAVASDSTWAGIRGIAEDSAKVVDALIFSLLVLHASTAVASDAVFDSVAHIISDSAVVSDQVIDSKRSMEVLTEQARAGDSVSEVLRVWHDDSAVASDQVLDAVMSLTIDSATISDQVIAQRYASTLVIDSAKASDLAIQAASVLVVDSVMASDLAYGRLHGKVLIEDGATAGDEVSDSRHSAALVLVDAAVVSDLVSDHLHAQDLAIDIAVAEDAPLGASLDSGQAWTANVDSWAMSRYAPYTFNRITVINGVMYGESSEGVFALNGGSDAVAGTVSTGKLDLGRGALVHPISAYLEYELGTGTAELDVTSTQSGTAETYTYQLPAESATELTNGRFTFGRGLRGRHFSFSLRLNARHGYINDMSVLVTPTNRRV